jgi:uridine kinase
MSDTIRIQISGPSKSGKTAIAQMLRRRLRDHGVKNVVLLNEDTHPEILHNITAEIGRYEGLREKNPNVEIEYVNTLR